MNKMQKTINDIKYINDNNSSTYIENVKVSRTLEEVPIIKYKIFDKYPELVAAFSTRLGGVSEGYIGSLNLGKNRGDDKEKLIENHRIFAEAVGYNYEKLVFSDQIHDIKLHVVSDEDAGKGLYKESDIIGIDGLLTNITDIPLMTFYADCVPLYFYDPENKAIALAHSGWRGTVNKIGLVMIRKMTEIYGTKPEKVICAIGPSICPKCYEVSGDVADEFKKAYSEQIWDKLLEDKGNDKYWLNLHQACRENFIEAGVLPENIAMPDLCTCDNKDILFSHRATAGKRGNLAAVIMLKSM